jgi:hypothetical protein
MPKPTKKSMLLHVRSDTHGGAASHPAIASAHNSAVEYIAWVEGQMKEAFEKIRVLEAEVDDLIIKLERGRK